MNYIRQINAFYDWLETNSISDSAIVLWHALMQINNRCGWKREFPVAISSIQNRTSLSKSSILRARNILQQTGRIVFKERKGNRSTIYSMLAFHNETQGDTQSGTQTETQSGTQTDTIPKLEETKPFIPIHAPPKKRWNSMPSAEIDLPLPQQYVTAAIEAMAFTKGIAVDEKKIIGMWGVFKKQNLTGKQFYQDEHAVFQHFSNWIKKQDFKNQNNGHSENRKSVIEADRDFRP